MDKRRLPLITPLFALAAVVLRVLPEVSDQLVFVRGGSSVLDLGRLFTCHLVHWSWEHLLWDALVFTVVGSWCERLDRKAFAIFLATAAIAIPPVVLLVNPVLGSYAGLSGLDVGAVMFAVSVSLLRQFPVRKQTRMEGRASGKVSRKPGAALPARQAAARIWFPSLLGIAVVGKVVYELLAGRTVMFDASADFIPVPLAHLVGVCVGAVVAIATVAKNRAVRQDRAA
ncbi:MAG: rhomboid family intramembrane serine protease [Deltaproteobacteria bacterium]|nr:rhomboid family intramembrane serine protease [Deltaproteobacteria bacterium]